MYNKLVRWLLIYTTPYHIIPLTVLCTIGVSMWYLMTNGTILSILCALVVFPLGVSVMVKYFAFYRNIWRWLRYQVSNLGGGPDEQYFRAYFYGYNYELIHEIYPVLHTDMLYRIMKAQNAYDLEEEGRKNRAKARELIIEIVTYAKKVVPELNHPKDMESD